MLSAKIKMATKDVENVLEKYNPYLALSFGKDSTALLWIIRKFKPGIKCLYRYYKTELPEIKEFREYITKEWDIDVELVYKDFTYRPTVGEHNLTFGQSQQRTYVDEKLCMTKHAHSKGFDCVILGMRAYESQNRFQNYRKRGKLYYNKSLGINISSPLAWWQTYEIEALIKYYKIPVSSLYSKNAVFNNNRLRSTDYDFTAMYAEGAMLQYKTYNPEIYFKLMKEYPELKKYS